MALKDFFADIFGKSAEASTPDNVIENISTGKEYVNGSVNTDQYAEYLQKSSRGELVYNSIDSNLQPIVNTSASNIHEIDLFGKDRQSDSFWNHHSRTKEDYYELASHIPKVEERLNAGESLESLCNDPHIGNCARLYYDPNQMPKVEQYRDTFISQGDNRHRILAAQDQGYNIPVRVMGTYDTYNKSQSNDGNLSKLNNDYHQSSLSPKTMNFNTDNMGDTKNINGSQNQSSDAARILSNDLNNPDLFNENKQGEYSYIRDEYGKSAFGSLELEKGTRDPKAQSNVGGEYRTERDDGGHLIGTRFKGDPGERNLEAQDRNLNRGAYKRMENDWAQSLEDGNKVFVNVESYRSNESERPDAFMGYQITEHPDGSRDWEAFSFQNESPEERNAQLEEVAQHSDLADQYQNAMDYPEDYNPADYEDVSPSKSHRNNQGEDTSQPESENKKGSKEQHTLESNQEESANQEVPESMQKTAEDQTLQSANESNDQGANKPLDNGYDYYYGYGY